MVAKGNSPGNRIPTGKGRRRALRRAAGLVLAAAFAAAASSGRSAADDHEDESGADGHRACTATARAALRACQSQSRDGYWTAAAICTNLSNAEERRECFAEKVKKEIYLHAALAHPCDKLVMFPLCTLDPQHIVKQKFIVIGRRQPL